MEIYQKVREKAAGYYRRLRQWKNFGMNNMIFMKALEKRKHRLAYPLIGTSAQDRLHLANVLGQETMSYAVVVILRNCNAQQAENTITSALKQVYTNLTIHVLDYDGVHKNVLTEERISYHNLLGQPIPKTVNEIVNDVTKTVDYIWLIPGGCGLHELALGIVTLYLQDVHEMPDLLYTDALLWDEHHEKIIETKMKPDYGTDTICGSHFIGNAIGISAAGWACVHGFDEAYPHSYVYDFILRLEEVKGVGSICHIPQPLVECWSQWHTNEPYCTEEDKKIITRHLRRQHRSGQVENLAVTTDIPCYRIEYELQKQPMVSILIPNKDNADILRQCVDSILHKSTYDNYEILIIENNSEQEDTFSYYRALEKNDKVRVITCETDWNYSYINNYGAKHAKGDYLLLLNNDTEVITPNWMEEMLAFAEREDVGAVGAKLFYPDGTIQHAGVTLGIRCVAGHAFHGAPGDDVGYMNRLVTVQNLTAVTAACMMIPIKVFREVGGFDENFKVAFNDTDLCMRIRRAEYQIVYQPEAQLYHYESKSRGSDEQSPEKLKRFNRESMHFQRQWCKELSQGDPFYNQNLSVWSDDFTPIETYQVVQKK